MGKKKTAQSTRQMEKTQVERFPSVFALLGLFLLGTYCVLSASFGAAFAELHLKFNFFNFPVFIGEIVLFLAFVLLFVMLLRREAALTLGGRLVFLYLAVIVVKALWDYHVWGPLAFRNAAMFYYPVAAYLAYTFYEPRFFRTPVLFLLVFGLWMISRLLLSAYFSLLVWIVAIVLSSHIARPFWRNVALTLVLLLWPYLHFFQQSRTGTLGVLVSVIAAGAIFFKYFLQWPRTWKAAAATCAVVFFAVGMFIFADVNRLSTVWKVREMAQTYQAARARVIANQGSFSPPFLSPALYNPEGTPSRHLVVKNKDLTEPTMALRHPVPDLRRNGAKLHFRPEPRRRRVVLEPVTAAEETALREEENRIYSDTDVRSSAHVNSVFRLLIWHDMAAELISKKAVFGVGFGQPQRSISIETLRWADEEWVRDGWITPHNSYLHFIYRAGIAGLGLVVFFFVLFVSTLRDFIRLRCWQGVLLCCAVLYFLVGANFLLFLELPYYAIPLWTLFGLTLAYKSRRELSHAN